MVGKRVRATRERVSRRLDATLPRAEYEYFLHELHEEAGHSLMFFKAIEASGLGLPSDAWRKVLLTPVMNLPLRQFVGTFYLPPAGFYELAGLTHGGWWRRMAARNPVHRHFVAQCLAPTLRVLEGYGLKPKL